MTVTLFRWSKKAKWTDHKFTRSTNFVDFNIGAKRKINQMFKNAKSRTQFNL